MLGIDTNVLVRLLVRDDLAQTRRARALIDASIRKDESVFVSLCVLQETEWVLRSRYGFEKESLLRLFRSMLETRELAFEDEDAFEEAVFRWKESSASFSDCLIIAHNRRLGCRTTATFDAKAARLPGAIGVV